jgi:hypothetical protein
MSESKFNIVSYLFASFALFMSMLFKAQKLVIIFKNST